MKKLLLFILLLVSIGHVINAQEIDNKYSINTGLVISFTGNGDMYGNGFYTHLDRNIYKRVGLFIGFEQYSYSLRHIILSDYTREELSQYIQFGNEEVGPSHYNITRDYVLGGSYTQRLGKHKMMIQLGGGYQRADYTYVGSINENENGKLIITHRYGRDYKWIGLLGFNYQYFITDYTSIGVAMNYRFANFSGGATFGLHF